jgi:plasmid stabilization system protein ParE
MALEVAWSPEAVEDLESIGAYIEGDSPFYARAVAGRIVAVIHGRRLIEPISDRFG